MDWLKQSRANSQLGQLLLRNKLISEDQLRRAIEIQKSSGQLLGDVMTQLGIVSQRQVQGMLRKQRHMRRVATLVTALLAPVQVYAADTVPVPVEQVQTLAGASNSAETSDGPAAQQSTLRALNEDELSDVVGQGLLDDALRDWLNLSATANINLAAAQNGQSNLLEKASGQIAGLQIAGTLLTLMDPLLALLNAQLTVADVTYNPNHTSSLLHPDGSVTLSIPSSIGELNFQNIRIMGTDGTSFGNIDIKGVNLTGTTVTLKGH